MAHRAYSYIRFSSSPQERGDSLRRQLDLSEAYAAEHGLELDTELRLHDLGLSAFDGSNVQRGALGAFLAAIERGKVKKGESLLVESLDRISRAQVMEALALFTQIINAGVSIVTLADRVVYSKAKLASDPMPLIMSILVMIRAHEESASKSRRMKEVWANKRRNAAAVKLTRTCPSWLELSGDRRHYKIVPEKARVVRRILKMHMDGIGQARIAKTLNEEGVAPIQSRVPTESWHSSTIQKIVSNRALYGAYLPTVVAADRNRIAAGAEIEGYFPALITRGEFELLQKRRTERALKGRGAKGESFTNLFSGLLRCGYCEGGINIAAHSSKTKKPARYLVCSRAKRGLGCYFITWSYEQCERLVLAFLRDVDFGELLAEEEASAKRGALEQRTAAAEAKRTDCRRRIAQLLSVLEDGRDAPRSVLDRLRSLEREEAAAGAEFSRAQSELDTQAATRSPLDRQRDLLALVRRMGSTDSQERFILRAKLAAEIRSLYEAIELYPGGYFMSDEEWIAFADGLSDEEIRRERLDVLRTPSKPSRWAVLHLRNGKRIATYNRREAQSDHRPELADLESLAVEF